MILLEIWKGILVVLLYLGAFVFAGALLPEKYHKSSLTNLCLREAGTLLQCQELQSQINNKPSASSPPEMAMVGIGNG